LYLVIGAPPYVHPKDFEKIQVRRGRRRLRL